MRKKNGFNIMFFVIITILFMNLSCTGDSEKSNPDILLKADREFSDMSDREGMFGAFLSFIAEDGVILRDNSLPARGRETLREYYSGKSDTSFTLTWEPLYEKISAGNDLGYTYGIWTNTVKQTGEVTKGTYATVWQKQKDGAWKFVLDLGTQGLPGFPKE
jgi:ketosteroid isomerase-like protein